MTGIQEGMAAAKSYSDSTLGCLRRYKTFTTVIGPPNMPLLQGDECLAPASLFPHPREPK
jgi:hypothetical protein